MESNKYETHWICRDCEYWYKSDEYFDHFSRCIWCGTTKFKPVRRRWTSTVVWYKPWTWLSGYFENQKIGRRI